MGITKEPFANEGATAEKSAKPDKFVFEDMQLKVGDQLLIQPPSRLSLERSVVNAIGYKHNFSLLVTAPITPNNQLLPLNEGENLVARIFSRQNAFSFTCTIVKICTLPFAYLHLSFPLEVQCSQTRKEPRVKTKIFATVTTVGGESLFGIITNLSANGAKLDASRKLAEEGESINLAFKINLHNRDTDLSVTAIVRMLYGEESAVKDATFIHHGLEFVDLQTNDSVILESFVYQHMMERPDTMILEWAGAKDTE